MSIKDIFVKKTPDIYQLAMSNIKDMIPENHFNKPQKNCEHMVESRWRIIDIPKHGKLIEISQKKPNEPRKYLNNKLTWVVDNVDPIFDNYVVQEYYVYTEK